MLHANTSTNRSGLSLLLHGLGSLGGAAGIALVAPLFILLVGLPIALAARGLYEVVAWLFPTLG
jgi:hypothetical protein